MWAFIRRMLDQRGGGDTRTPPVIDGQLMTGEDESLQAPIRDGVERNDHAVGTMNVD